MADARALTLQDGQFTQVKDTDALYVGDEILRDPGAVLSDFNLLTDSKTGTIYIGRTGQIANLAGGLQVDENSSLLGDVTLGDAPGDLLQINAATTHLTKDTDHTILVDTLPSGAGRGLTITAGQSGDNAGGGFNINGGQGDSNGGPVQITGGAAITTGKGGNINIYGGDAPVGGGGTAGGITIDAGNPSTGNRSGINIGTNQASQIYIGNDTSDLILDTDTLDLQLGGVSILQGSGTTLTLQAAGTLDCSSGTFALPSQFYIGTPSAPANQVSANFSAANASTLVDGGSAVGLHTHPGGGGGGSTTDLTGHNAGEAISKGAGTYLKWDSVNAESRVYNACADSTGALPYVLGISTDNYSVGDDATIRMLGETDVPTGMWVNAPTATTDVGKPVYLSDQTGANKGKLALAADIPTGSGDYIVRVGYVSLHSISGADAKVVVMKHEETKKS